MICNYFFFCLFMCILCVCVCMLSLYLHSVPKKIYMVFSNIALLSNQFRCLCMSSVLFHCASAYVPGIGENNFISLIRFVFLNRAVSFFFIIRYFLSCKHILLHGLLYCIARYSNCQYLDTPSVFHMCLCFFSCLAVFY